jgi:L-threonylcarbamoyladenylate synthase
LKINKVQLLKAVETIRQGGVVAYPTETYYGLGVDPFNPKALSRLFQLKRRPQAKPILTLIYDQKQLSLLTPTVPSLYKPLCDLWPAPLTLIFQSLPSLPSLLTADTGTIAIRISPHPLASALVHACGHPITATSANISGAKAAMNPEEVQAHFGDRIDFVLEGGKTCGGMPSTVVAARNNALVLIREGVIPFEKIKHIVSC